MKKIYDLSKMHLTRREFTKNALISAGTIGAALTYLPRYISKNFSDRYSLAFANDGPVKLWKWSKKAEFYSITGSLIRCELCPHECLMGEGDRGFCRTRINFEGDLYTIAYGNPCSYQVDPMEKKPLFHFLPGSGIFSIATAGCNLRCNNCQNWEISQAKPEETRNTDMPPKQVVNICKRAGCRSIAYTYSDPIIFYEYMYDTAVLAKDAGIKNVMVTAGYINEKPLKKLAPVIDAANVDIKGFSDEFYIKNSHARLDPVLKGIEVMLKAGVWVEITTLIVPTLSDDPEMIRDISRWIVKNLSRDVPLHFSRFHPDFKLKHLPPTPVETLVQAREIALAEGLRYVYIGNIYGDTFQHTYCPTDHKPLVIRDGYKILETNLDSEGRCKWCKTHIPGLWR